MTPNGQSAKALEALKLSKVHRDFWGRPKQRALEDFDLAMDPGRCVGLVGPSGSGKSTVLKLAAGLQRPSSGAIRIFGQDPRKPGARCRIGYMPQELAFDLDLNPVQALDLSGRMIGLNRRDRKRHARTLIDRVGLQGDHHRRCRELSPGLRRRLGLARALLGEPELLLLDHPSAGLDPLGRLDLKAQLKALRDQGTAILMVVEWRSELDKLAHDVHVLYKGRTVTRGEIVELTSRPDLAEITARKLTEDKLEALHREIEKAGGEVVSLRPPQESLETFFQRIFRSPKRRSKRAVSRLTTKRPLNHPRLSEDLSQP